MFRDFGISWVSSLILFPKMSTVGAEATVDGSVFHSLMVLGKKEFVVNLAINAFLEKRPTDSLYDCRLATGKKLDEH